MITLARMMFLQKFELFSKMSSKVLNYVASVSDEATFAAGESILHADDYGDCMYLVVEGRVRVHLGPLEMAVLGPGEQFGEMSLIDGESRSASVTAISDCLLLRIQQADFHRILIRSPETALSVLRLITKRLRKWEKSMFEAELKALNGGKGHVSPNG